MLNRIIIDTDIGTNADDAVAIALAAKSPEILVEGVTTVYGQVVERAQIASAILAMSGSGAVSVYPGIEQCLLRSRAVYWSGLEGKGLQLRDENVRLSDHAVDFIRKTVMDNPGEITLVTIGPLTNIAAAIIREPAIAKQVKQIVMMGGVTRLGAGGIHLEYAEHNVKCDPEAASVVFGSGAPILMLGYDVTRQIVVTREEVAAMAACGTPLAETLTRLMVDHMDFLGRDFTFLNDPLTIGALLDRSIVRSERMNVWVEYDRRSDTALTIAELNEKGNVEVCLEAERQRFLTMLSDRLFSSFDS